MIEVVDLNKCCGCAACANICPKKAISIVQDEEGFYKHHINQDLCINCGLCQKVCPQINFEYENFDVPSCYAAMADDELREKSSSGGVFGVLAHEILKLNGIVCGAAFDENWVVKHIIVDNMNDLEKLHGSKYVQSFISEDLFKKIKNYLDEGRYVLFSGVPCQVAGLHNFLKKDYDKLYTVDLICAYAPSPKVFKKFLEENYNRHDINKISFRDKETFGWNAINIVLEEKKNKIIDNKYMKPYLNRMFKGEHCVNCSFKRFPRPGDFTIGDFWKIQNFTKDMDDRKGTSAICLNTSKAEKLFSKIKSNFKKIKSMPLNGVSWQIDVPNKIHRTLECKSFYHHLNNSTFDENVKTAPKNSKVGIINWWFINNRGAILTNYALNEMVKELGYNSFTINYISPFERENYQKGYVKAFTDKYIQKTRWIENRYDLEQLNSDIGTFICGSDQIFNFAPCYSHNMIFYMDWVDVKNNKLISYAASFAYDTFKAQEHQKNLVKHLLSRFDYHSIREEEGVAIMQNTFGLDAKLILDPVFCIDKQKYVDIAEQSTDKLDAEDFIVYYYTVPDRIKNAELIDYVMKMTGVKKAINLFSWDIPMENWLWYFIHAKFVLTNSFHGVCFSLIFNKPWLAFVVDGKEDSRFSTLIKLSNMKERVFYNIEEIFKADYLFKHVDFSYFNNSIKGKIQDAYNWLSNAMNSPKTYKLNAESEMYDALLGDYNDKIKKAMIYTWSCEQRIKMLENKINTIEAMQQKHPTVLLEQSTTLNPSRLLRKKVLPRWLGNIICCFIPKKKNRDHFREKYINH